MRAIGARTTQNHCASLLLERGDATFAVRGDGDAVLTHPNAISRQNGASVDDGREAAAGRDVGGGGVGHRHAEGIFGVRQDGAAEGVLALCKNLSRVCGRERCEIHEASNGNTTHARWPTTYRLLCRAQQRVHVPLGDGIAERHSARHRGLAARERACLIEHYGVYARRRLQRRAALDEHAVLGADAGAWWRAG